MIATMTIREVRNYNKGFVVMKTDVLEWVYSKDTSFKRGEEVDLEVRREDGKWWVTRKEKEN